LWTAGCPYVSIIVSLWPRSGLIRNRIIDVGMNLGIGLRDGQVGQLLRNPEQLPNLPIPNPQADPKVQAFLNDSLSKTRQRQCNNNIDDDDDDDDDDRSLVSDAVERLRSSWRP